MRFSTVFVAAAAATGLLGVEAAPLGFLGITIPPLKIGGTDPAALALACISVGGTLSDASTVCKLKDSSIVTVNALTSTGTATVKVGSGAGAGQSIVIKIGDLGGLVNNLLNGLLFPVVSKVSSVIPSPVVTSAAATSAAATSAAATSAAASSTITSAPLPVNTAAICAGHAGGDLVQGILCPVVTIVSEVVSVAVPAVSQVVSVAEPIVSQVVSLVPEIVNGALSIVPNLLGTGTPGGANGGVGNVLSLGLPAPTGLPLLSLGGGKILRSVEDGKKRLATEEDLE